MFHLGNGGPNLGPIGPKGSVQFKNEQVDRSNWGKYFLGTKSLMPYLFGDPPETYRKKRTRLREEEQREKYPNRPQAELWWDEDEMEGPGTLREGYNENGPVEYPPAGQYPLSLRKNTAKLATRYPRLTQMTPDEQAQHFIKKYPSKAHELHKEKSVWYVGDKPLLKVLRRRLEGGAHTKKKKRRSGR
jgi:hypothetical protein